MKWQDDLHRRASHKALDIPDEMSVNANKTFIGITWKEILAAVLGGGGLLYMMGMLDRSRDDEPPAVQHPQFEDTDTTGTLQTDR